MSRAQQKTPIKAPITGKRNMKRAEVSTKLSSLVGEIVVKNDIKSLKTLKTAIGLNHNTLTG